MKIRREKVPPEIPTSSMADIAFLLIIFFMVTAVFAATKGLEFKLPKEEEDAPVAEEGDEEPGDSGEEPSEAPADDEAEEESPAAKEKVKKPFGSSDDDAEVLDVESSDPEIQLDLARAYISMGDREAARVILEEVIANGSEKQQAEAQKMLDLM